LPNQKNRIGQLICEFTPQRTAAGVSKWRCRKGKKKHKNKNTIPRQWRERRLSPWHEEDARGFVVMMVQFSSLHVLGKYSFEYKLEWMIERLSHNKLQRRRGWLELYGEVKSLITIGGKAGVAPASIQKAIAPRES